jgi:predicted pyridoxine 5'-phosphate oxidase superfamily flavin-nucleotide-binding protein
MYKSDIVFTPTVKAIQERMGSRQAYARQEQAGSWPGTITPELAAFIAEQTSFFLATANRDGQPYIQHRGGPPGFLQVLDSHRLGFADYSGNRQYITLGNLSENPKAALFLIDYVHRRRVKIWGRARAVEDDPALTTALMPKDYRARPERAMLFEVETFDFNCPQHIPQRFEARDVAHAIEQRDARIAELERELAEAKARLERIA